MYIFFYIWNCPEPKTAWPSSLLSVFRVKVWYVYCTCVQNSVNNNTIYECIHNFRLLTVWLLQFNTSFVNIQKVQQSTFAHIVVCSFHLKSTGISILRQNILEVLPASCFLVETVVLFFIQRKPKHIIPSQHTRGRYNR